jgi:hypothetical protein
MSPSAVPVPPGRLPRKRNAASIYGHRQGGKPLLDLIAGTGELGYEYIRLDTNGQKTKQFLGHDDFQKLDELAFSLDGYSPDTRRLLISPCCSHIFGCMYENGRGVPQDYAAAMSWYRKATDWGYAIAQNNLGAMFQWGRGVRQDDAAAASWYRKAADQGYAVAQNNLGGMYAEGRGVAQDDAAAVKWYRKAADHNHTIAQNNLGLMYANGHGAWRRREGTKARRKIAIKSPRK